MKTIASESAALEEGVAEEASSTSGEEKQLNQPGETKETSVGARAATTEDGPESVVESSTATQSAEACRADRDNCRDQAATKVEKVDHGETTFEEHLESPGLFSAKTLSRTGTAAFTGEVSTCRFSENLAARTATVVSEDETGTETRAQKVMMNGIGGGDAPEAVIPAAPAQQQQGKLCEDAPDALGCTGPEGVCNEVHWDEGAFPKSAAEDKVLNVEMGARNGSSWETSKPSDHAAVILPERRVVRGEPQPSVSTRCSSETQELTLQTSCGPSFQSSQFAAFDAVDAFSFRHSDTQRGELPQNECASNDGKDNSVEHNDFQQEEYVEAETKAANETEERKEALFAEHWQIKRSASDGPSASVGMWRTGDDFRGRVHTDLDLDSTREKSAKGQVLPQVSDVHPDRNASSHLRRNAVLGPEGELKFDTKPPGASPTAFYWQAASRGNHESSKATKRCDSQVIRSLSSLSRGISAGKERHGNSEIDVVRVRDSSTGGTSWLDSPLRTKSPSQDEHVGAAHSGQSRAGTGWKRSIRRASMTGTLQTIQTACTGSTSANGTCFTGKPLVLSVDEYCPRKDPVFRAFDAPTVRRQRAADDKAHSVDTTGVYASSPSLLPKEGSYRGAPKGNSHNSRDPAQICEGGGDKSNDPVRRKDSKRVPPGSNQSVRRSDIVESGKPILSAWESGITWESADALQSCTGVPAISEQGGHNTWGKGVIEAGEVETPVPPKRGGPAEESEGARLVRELVEEFDKRRTNFSILVPKVLELVGVLMGRPVGTRLPCVFPRNFSPAASILSPCPLPTCASFSEMGQTCTVEKLEKYFPTFNVEGGLLLCTQVLKQVSRPKQATLDSTDNQAFKLPAAAKSSEASSCNSRNTPKVLSGCATFTSCNSGRALDSEQQQAAQKGEDSKVRTWVTESPPLTSPLLLRSLLDPLPPADALLPEPHPATPEESSPDRTAAEGGEQRLEMGSTSASTHSSRGAAPIAGEMEAPAAKRKIVEGLDISKIPGPSLEGSRVTRRSTCCTSVSLYSHTTENSTNSTPPERLRRAGSMNSAPVAKTQSSVEHMHPHSSSIPIPSLGSSPTTKREAEVWEAASVSRIPTRESEHTDDLPQRETTKTDRGQESLPTLLSIKPANTFGSTQGGGKTSRAERSGEARWCEVHEGDECMSPGAISPAVSPAPSSASLASSAFYGSPLWGDDGEPLTKKEGKSGMLSVVRSSNPQRLVRVYRSLVVEDKTHVVERLLRVWSMTLHARTLQSPYSEKELHRSAPPSFQEKHGGEKLLSSKYLEATVDAPGPHGLDDETDDKQVSSGEGATEEEDEEEQEEVKDMLTPLTQYTDNVATDERDSSAHSKCNGRRCGGPFIPEDAASGRSAHVRARERTAGPALRDPFLLKKSNTTECGRILRAVRTAEKSPDGFIHGGDNRRRQNLYESGAGNSRSVSRLRRASTSAGGNFRFERHLNRCRGREQPLQVPFVWNDTCARVTSPNNHDFGRPTHSKRRSDTGQTWDPSNCEPHRGMLGGGDAFLWRPCMSVLWVKPLTVEQTMLKWSKSTPLFEPMEELVAGRRSNQLPAEVISQGGVSHARSPPLSMTLRSAPTKGEEFSAPTNSAKASCSEKRGEKITPPAKACSPASVRSEPSTSSDFTSSLPTSPLFAQAPALESTGIREQQQHSQAACIVARPQVGPTFPQPSHPSAALLQVIQHQILQLLQADAKPPREHAALTQALPCALERLSSKSEKASICRNIGIPTDSSVYSKELSLGLKLDKAKSGPRRSNTWAAPDPHGASQLLESCGARSYNSVDLRPQRFSCSKTRQYTATQTKGRGVSRASTLELHYSSSTAAETCVGPLKMIRELDSFEQNETLFDGSFSRCSFVPVAFEYRSPRGARRVESSYANDDDNPLTVANAVLAQEEHCAEVVAQFDEAITLSSKQKRDVGHVEHPHRLRDEKGTTADILAGGEQYHENPPRGGAGPTEDGKSSAAQRPPATPKSMELQQSTEHPEKRGVLGQCGPTHSMSAKPIEAVADIASITRASTGISSQGSAQFGNELGSFGLLSRLLGLSAKAYGAGEEGHATAKQELKDTNKNDLAYQTAQALAALLACQGDLPVATKSAEGVSVTPPPTVAHLVSSLEDHAPPTDSSIDNARRSEHSSRKRALDTVGLRKAEDRKGEGWKRAGGFEPSSEGETSVGNAAGFLQQHCSDGVTKASPFAQRQKKTKWTALHPDEGQPEATEAADAPDYEQLPNVQEHVTDRLSATPEEEITAEDKERGSPRTAFWERHSSSVELLNLFFEEVRQHTSSAISVSRKDQNE